MSGQLGTARPVQPVFAEVEVADPPLLPAPTAEGTGRIGIELPSGIKLSVDASVDGEALARVLSVLGR